MELINNTDQKQFQLKVDDATVYIEYIEAKGKIYFTHTEVPLALEGKGYGGKIVKMALEHVRQRNIDLVPLCPFVAAYIKRHPEWKDIVWEGVNLD